MAADGFATDAQDPKPDTGATRIHAPESDPRRRVRPAKLPIPLPIFVTDLVAPDGTQHHTAMRLTCANATP
jgi:hypothetical protein